MKKILSTTLIAIMLSTALVNTVKADRPRRSVKKQGQQPRRIVRRKRNLPEPTGKATPRQVAQAAKQAEIEAKKLQADAQKVQAGKAPETTVVTDVKKVEANIGKIEQQLANLRTWSGDVLPGGYSLAEKNKAQDIAAPYIKESEALKQRIKMNQDKIALITTKTWFGLGAAKVHPGRQEEYDRYKKLIAIDEIRLAKLTPIIAQQEIIMGTARSTAVKTAYAGMAIAAMTIGADYLLEGALSKTATNAISSVYSTVAWYTPTSVATAFSQVKSGINYYLGRTPTQDQDTTNKIFEDALKGSTEEEQESILRTWVAPGLQKLGNIAAQEVKGALLSAFKAGARTGTNLVLKNLYNRVITLADNPATPPEEMKKANKDLEAELARMKRTSAAQ